jgi:hypothetical protein
MHFNLPNIHNQDEPISINKYSTENFVLLNQKWGGSQSLGVPGGNVSVSFAETNYTGQFDNFDSFITNADFKDDIISAFSMWEEVANINFILSPDAPTVDIRVGFVDIDGPNGVLGQTHFPSFGPMKNVQVVLDAGENWGAGLTIESNELSFRYVASHEIGHAIGVGHPAMDDALMSTFYNPSITNLQEDDILAVQAIYGASNIDRVDVNRFFNKINGGHFFTADQIERNNVLGIENFRFEGIGFEAISSNNNLVNGTVPVHRFYNESSQSHFFTADEIEKEAVMALDNYFYEGVGFNAFLSDTVSKEPVHRFFNLETGGHLFTTFQGERDVLMELPSFRYEGVGFYAYEDSMV